MNGRNRTGRASGATRIMLREFSLRSHHARRSRTSNFLVTPPPQGGSTQNVVWTNTVGVTVSGNNLTATGNGWNTSGAVSTQSIASGEGYVEFTASETNTYRMIGLSHGDTNQNFDDIDFAFYLMIGGQLNIYEGGGLVGNFGTYVAGDVLRVAVEGGVVKYRKNGTVLCTSTTPTYPLLVDTSLYSTGATLTNVVINGAAGGGNSAANSLSLNGSGAYESVPSSASLNITGSITLEAWVKPSTSMSAAQIVSRYGASDGGYQLGIYNGKLRMDILHTGSAYNSIAGNTTLSLNAWHHVAGVFDGSQYHLYLDGVLDASNSSTYAPAAGNGILTIGRDASSVV